MARPTTAKSEARRNNAQELTMDSILSIPAFYDFLQFLIRGKAYGYTLVNEFIRPRPGDRVLDIGCGTGAMCQFLSDVQYVGFDMDPAYIRTCRRRLGTKGEFHHRALSHETVDNYDPFDIVLAIGVVHHLTDAEANTLFQLASRVLRPSGRLVTMDGVRLPRQSTYETLLLNSDRGKHIRTTAQYLDLAKAAFSSVTPVVTHTLLRIPYPSLVMVCTK